MAKQSGKLPYVLVAVFVCLMACGTMGLPNAYGVFFKPMAEALGLGIGAVTLQVSICSMAIGLFTPVVSKIVAQGRGMRPLMGAGMLLIALSGVVIALSENLAFIYVASAVRGIGLAAMSMLIITLYIGNWFEKGRGTITGLALSGSGIGSALASPVLTSCIERFGYQSTYLGFVAVTVLSALPVMLFFPLTPQEAGLEPFGAGEAADDAAQAPGLGEGGARVQLRLGSRPYIVLAVFVVCMVLVTTLAGHMAGLAQDYGYSAQLGGLLLSACMVGNVASKFVLGALADRFGVFRAIVCSLATTACGLALILLNPGGEAALLAAGFLYGTSFSIGSLGISLLTRYMYGDVQYADAYSSLSLVTSLASAAGVSIAGAAYDVTGSYAVPVAAGLVLVGVAGGCLAFLRAQAAAGDRRRAAL